MKTTRVGFLGPVGTFTHEALRSQTDLVAAESVAYPTIGEALTAVTDGHIDVAVVYGGLIASWSKGLNNSLARSTSSTARLSLL